MTLDKAIELSKQCEYSLRKGKKIDHADAVLLGIEALKRLELMREVGIDLSEDILPGESNPTSNPAAKAYLNHIKESPLGREPKG